MNPREKRFLKYLIENDKIMVKDLRELIGALNPAQIASALREQGWKINTGYIKVKDRDGKTCRPGYYWMPDSERIIANKFLKKTKNIDERVSSSSKKSKFKMLEFMQNNNMRRKK